MDDLLREFLTETYESLDRVDAELVRFEREPNNAEILGGIFRLVHTIKGTCGFLGLPRLEALTHAAETLMGKFRDGLPVSADAVTLILRALDRIKLILREIEAHQSEPDGADGDLIEVLNRFSSAAAAAGTVRRSLQHELPVDPDQGAEPGAAEAVGAEHKESGSPATGHSIRVSVDTLDHLMTTVSELVLTRNQLLEIVRRQADSDFEVPLQRLSNVTAELQEGVMKTRMQPIGNAWQKLPRIVRDLCTELDKEIELKLVGVETELDRQVLELVRDPLTHLVRNCADHGIEPPADRLAAGKSRKGTISLTACHQGGHIIIEVADDGRGLDLARIRARAFELGLASESEIAAKTDADIVNYIFAPGFSTAARITSVSGRGVGMDVVRNNIEQLGGTIDLKTVPGAGTIITIKMPLTLAIVAALIVEAGTQRFAIPQLAVLELVRVGRGGEHRVERIKDTPVLRLRNLLLPLICLKEALQLGQGDAESGFVVVTQVGSQAFGIVVDAVFHTEEIVIKPMSSKLRHIPAFSGTTILGDGSVIMIIDPHGIMQMLGRGAQALREHEPARDGRSAEAAGQDNVALLVFRAGSQQPKAVPLSLITRLEEIDCRAIENSDGRYLVQYRNQLMPLLQVDPGSNVRREGTLPILVFADHGRSMGLIVDEIVDIVEDRLDVEVASDRPGIVGYAVVKGATTEIVDIGHFLPQAFADWFRRRDSLARNTDCTVLLVDDSSFFRDLLTPLIKANGCKVRAAACAADALALLKSGQNFDLVITDIEMPDMDGFGLAEAIHADPALASVPVIGITAMVSAEMIERGRQAGFHDFVAKFDRAGLIAAIKEQTIGVEQAA